MPEDRREAGNPARASAEHEDPAGAPPGAVEAVALLAEHPSWAIWLPVGGRDWTAVRPASSRPPGPDLPLLWAQASTAAGLARKMRALDEQAAGGGWP